MQHLIEMMRAFRRRVRTHIVARRPPPPTTHQDAVLKFQVRSQMKEQARWLDAELELLSRREQEQRRE